LLPADSQRVIQRTGAEPTDAVSNRYGKWPVFSRLEMAGFEMSTEAGHEFGRPTRRFDVVFPAAR
jgi:hypothetical protein